MDTAEAIRDLVVDSIGDEAVIEQVQESPQLREQDGLNLCTSPAADASGTSTSAATFYARNPSGGESAADVYDRMTIFQDHMVRDMTYGRFGQDGCVVLVTHSCALRVFLMRWLHWRVAQFVAVQAPGPGEVVVMEKVHDDRLATSYQPFQPAATKPVYQLSAESRSLLSGVTEPMCMTQAQWARDNMARTAKKKAVGSLTW